MRQRGEMRGREVAVLVLNQMQMLDQQVAAARPVAQQRLDLVQRARGRPGGPSAYGGLRRLAAGIRRCPQIWADCECSSVRLCSLDKSDSGCR